MSDIENSEELKIKPRRMLALTTMYSHKEDTDSVIEVFIQAIHWYQNRQPKSSAHLSLIRDKFKYEQMKEVISDLEKP